MGNRWQSASWKRAAGLAMVFAPVFVLLSALIRLLAGRSGPGFGWTVGHLTFLVGLGLFAVVVAELWQQARAGARGRRWAADVSAGVAVAGLLALSVQFVIDIAVGLQAGDRAEMGRMFDQIQALPGVLPVFYMVGPALFYVGLVALAVALVVARPRRLSVPAGVLMVAGAVLPAISIDLIPVSALCMWLALAPVGWRLVRTGEPTAARPVLR